MSLVRCTWLTAYNVKNELRADLQATEKRWPVTIDGLELKISAYASRWNEEFDRLHSWVKEIDERVDAIEARGKQ